MNINNNNNNKKLYMYENIKYGLFLDKSYLIK